MNFQKSQNTTRVFARALQLVFLLLLGLLPTLLGGCAGFVSGANTNASLVAPVITTQPVNQTVTAGQTAVFTVVATGTAPMTYQWQKNGANISGATSASYTTPATAAADNGSTFKAVISNSAGNATSNAATLTVTAGPVAPAITTQPVNQTVAAGQSATFSVVASGTAPLAYQWQKNGANISGATWASYTTPATTASDSGSTFVVVVSNSAGNVTSNSASLTVNAAAVAPAITTQPSNQTLTAGQTATFSVAASGTAPLSYQWQKNGANISGATSASYTTPATTTSDSGSTFIVVVSNSAGTATSNAATLTVNPAPVAPAITTQPANQTVTAGQTATFTVVASGTAPLAYQWQKNGANISGATSASYTTPATATSDSGSTFRVVVTNSVGTSTSNSATLTVNPAPVAPTITTQPANQTVTAGQTATFGVVATGTAPLSYQWQKNGVNISGATSASYTTPATTTSDSGSTFVVVVSNSAGTANSNAATLTVNPAPVAPVITTQPANQTVTAGQTAAFSVTATGTATLSYQWQKNGANISGATSASYTTPATTTSDSGSTFKVVVTNSAGTATSNSATLTVNPAVVPPSITTQPVNQSVTTGQTATFSVVAGGTAPLSYQWQKNGANISGATSSSYTTPATTASDSGSTFVVVVSNSAGTATSNAATLTVTAAPVAPTITTQPVNQTVTAGQTATFSVVASGTAPLSYQWQKNSANIPGATSASYTTPATTTSDNGSTFAVVVTNSAGSATSNAATLTVNPAPVAPTITTQPANQTVTAGQTATFSVTASGTAPLSYQWQKNSANIPGATSASYTTPATTTSDNGSTFVVVVTNSAGSATSNAATLTVNPAPVAPTITTQPANQTVTAGQTATFSVTASGTAPLSYQWQKNSANIPGATSASYTTPATTTSDNGSTFVVVVTNSAGSATSNAATLTVNPAPVAPTITTQPANQTVTAGQTATFSVTASGTAPLSYQWQKNGTNIPGATSASYTTPATTTSDNGSTLVVVVSNSAGTATSNAATLTVNAPAPTITGVNPTSGSVGTSVTITGTNFGSTQGTSTVAFNGTAATPTAWSATSIRAPVPTGASTGNLIVTVSGVASNGVNFTVTTGNVAWPIKASSNNRYFTDANGVPWMMVADAGHHLMPAIPQSAVAAYLTDRVSHGFNAVDFYFMCANAGTCLASGAAFDGTLPFTTGTGPSSYDLSTPNAAYWAEVDNVIAQAAADGLVVFVDPIPWNVAFSSTLQNNGATKDFNFGVFLGNRYKNSPNIIWHVGQDFDGGSFPSASNLNLVAQLMAGIRSVDTNHPMMCQFNTWASYSQQGSAGNATFAANLTSDFVYTYYETYDYVLAGYKSSPTLPAVMGEANYETGNNTGSLSSPANAFITRMEMWYTMTSGATGFEFGNEHVNHFDSSYQTNLDTTATAQVQYLPGLFGNYPWWTFVPDQTHTVVTAGYGTYNAGNLNLYNATYATTLWDGSTTAIVYTPVSTTFTVNMANFSRTITAFWYDPTTGSSSTIGSFANSGVQTFTTPGTAHADGTHDWVLVLDPPANVAAPAIQVNPTSINFGNDVAGTTTSQSLIISNPGTATLTISQINVSGSPFSANGFTLPLSINAGQQTTITVAFVPASVGAVSGSLSLVSNASTSPTVVNLSGSGVAATLTLGLSPASLSFGNITTGTTSAAQTVTVTNTGNSNVSISQITLSGAGFLMTGGSASVTLSPSQSLTVSVTFGPTVTGSVTGSISIVSNATGSPATVTLSGAGIAAVQHSVTLTWVASTSTVSGYNIYRSTISGSGYVKVNAALVSGLTYTDSTVQNGTTYYYVTTAVDSSGNESLFSNEVTAVIP